MSLALMVMTGFTLELSGINMLYRMYHRKYNYILASGHPVFEPIEK